MSRPTSSGDQLGRRLTEIANALEVEIPDLPDHPPVAGVGHGSPNRVHRRLAAPGLLAAAASVLLIGAAAVFLVQRAGEQIDQVQAGIEVAAESPSAANQPVPSGSVDPAESGAGGESEGDPPMADEPIDGDSPASPDAPPTTAESAASSTETTTAPATSTTVGTTTSGNGSSSTAPTETTTAPTTVSTAVTTFSTTTSVASTTSTSVPATTSKPPSSSTAGTSGESVTIRAVDGLGQGVAGVRVTFGGSTYPLDQNGRVQFHDIDPCQTYDFTAPAGWVFTVSGGEFYSYDTCTASFTVTLRRE